MTGEPQPPPHRAQNRAAGPARRAEKAAAPQAYSEAPQNVAEFGA